MLCVVVCIGMTGGLTGCFTLLMVFALSFVLAARLVDLRSCESVKERLSSCLHAQVQFHRCIGYDVYMSFFHHCKHTVE